VPTVTASTMIADLELADKVGCHRGAVEFFGDGSDCCVDHGAPTQRPVTTYTIAQVLRVVAFGGGGARGAQYDKSFVGARR
jgi:hypothetical protein